MEIRRASQHASMPWANGRGVSHEVARLTGDDGQWLWRVAIAPVVEDGPFSPLPGVHRELTLIEGCGLVLTIDGESMKVPEDGVVRFWGGATTCATLTNGPVVDLNVMSREGHEKAIQIVRGPGVTGEFACVVALEDSKIEFRGGAVALAARDAIVGGGSGLRLMSGRFAVVHARR